MAMPADFAHCANAAPRNSGPLSVRSTCGSRRWLCSRSKIRISRSGGDGGVDLDVQRLAVEVVHDVEQPKAPAADQRVAHEVGGPDRVRLSRHIQRHALPFWESSLGSAAQVEPHQLVHPVDPLVFHGLPCRRSCFRHIQNPRFGRPSTSLASAPINSASRTVQCAGRR
jgi:hypothetical protein